MVEPSVRESGRVGVPDLPLRRAGAVGVGDGGQLHGCEISTVAVAIVRSVVRVPHRASGEVGQRFDATVLVVAEDVPPVERVFDLDQAAVCVVREGERVPVAIGDHVDVPRGDLVVERAQHPAAAIGELDVDAPVVFDEERPVVAVGFVGPPAGAAMDDRPIEPIVQDDRVAGPAQRDDVVAMVPAVPQRGAATKAGPVLTGPHEVQAAPSHAQIDGPLDELTRVEKRRLRSRAHVVGAVGEPVRLTRHMHRRLGRSTAVLRLLVGRRRAPDAAKADHHQ